MLTAEKQAAGRLAGVGRGLKTFLTDYAAPLAVGGLSQYHLTQPHGDVPGMDPVSAAFFSAGAGALASPKDWAHVWRSRKLRPEVGQVTNMLAAAKPLAITKLQFAGAGAGAGLLQQMSPMIKNISDTTKNVSNITKNVETGSAEIPGLAKQVSTDVGGTTHAIAEGANQLKDTIGKASPQIADNLVDASKNVKGTSGGLDKIVDQVSQAAGSVNDVANMVKDPAVQSATGKAVKTQTDFMDSASKLMDGVRKYAPAVGAGALGLGGGYLALQWLKNRSEENRKERTMQAMFPARLKAAASVDIKIRKPVSRVIRSGGPGSSKWQTGHSYQGAQTKAAHASVLQSIVDAISDSTADTGRSFGSDVRTMRTALPIAGGAAGMGSGLMLGSSLGAMLGAHRGNTVAGVGRGAIRGAGIGAGAGAGLGLGAAVLSKLQDSGVDIKEPLMLAGIPLAGAVAGGSLGHSLTDSMLGNPKDENTPEASPMSRGLVTGAAGAVPGFLLGGPTGAAIAGLGSGALGYMAQRNRQQEYNHKVAAAHDCGAALASLTNRTKTVTRQEASAVGPNMVTKLREMSA